MKYTEKQIEKFKEMYQNGILEQLEEYDRLDIIENIIGIDEATIIAGCSISIDELIEIADSRCELGDLAETATKEYNRRYPKPIEKQNTPNYKADSAVISDIDLVDLTYYRKLCDDAVSTIGKFVDFNDFVTVDYPVGYGFVDVNPDCDGEEEVLPWTN